MSSIPDYDQNGITLYRGESLDLLRELSDNSVDAVIADPPYSSGGFTRGDRVQDPIAKYQQTGVELIRSTFSGDNRDGRSWCYWMTLWLSEAHRATRDSGYCLIFTDWRMLPLASDALQAGGFVWRGLVTWDKTEGARAPHTGYFRHQAEFIVWGTKGVSKPSGHGGPWPGVFRCSIKHKDKHHLTGKPTELMEFLCKIVPPGGLILDPFIGSGTTAVAAINTGRRCIGIEQSPAIFETCLQRVSAATKRHEESLLATAPSVEEGE
jgi:site-specific DNA-methyltransferase (adenine-specific)